MGEVVPIRRKQIRLLMNYVKATWPKAQPQHRTQSNHTHPIVRHDD